MYMLIFKWHYLQFRKGQTIIWGSIWPWTFLGFICKTSLLFQPNQPGRELGSTTVPGHPLRATHNLKVWPWEHRGGFPHTPLMRKPRRKGVWGDAAAPRCLVELTCQVEQGSVPQSQGTNFSTKANQKEKGEEKAGVVVQLMEFPFSIGSVAQKRQSGAEKAHQRVGKIYPVCYPKSALLMGLYRSLPIGFHTDAKN